MSANASVATATLAVRDHDRAHRIRLICGYVLAISLIVALLIYGFDYYTLSQYRPSFFP